MLILLQLPALSLAQEQLPPDSLSGEESTGRLYVTSSERREAGLKHEVTSWLSASFLLELEGETEAFRTNGSGDQEHQRSGSGTLQMGFIFSPWKFAKGELVAEYDTETEQLIADEAFISLEIDDWEIEAGRMYTPLGTYISHFATGPILEVGETRADALILSYDLSDQLDISISAYKGDARQTAKNPNPWDWTMAFDAWLSETVSVGLSYQSDLADSDERLLRDRHDRYFRKVPALGGYAVWSLEQYEISFETLGALRSFHELNHDRDQPLAWNLEFVHFFSEHFEWALRMEGSHELEDAPELGYGISLTWRIWQNSSLTAEYLRGKFKDGMAVNDDDESYDRIEKMAAQFSVVF